MKKHLFSALAACALLYACGSKQEGTAPSFSFEVVPDSSFTNLPGLHSFAIGEGNGEWLLLGGRTNGFHGFSDQQNFPVRKANMQVYAYNISTHLIDSLSVDSLPPALKWQFRSTNMQHVQVGNYLYISGGYGATINGTDTTYMTYPVFTRIDVPAMLVAIHSHNYAAFRKALVYDQHPIVQATGGEMFRMPSGEFYMVLGHNFSGRYSASDAVQVYLDSVRVFTITETDTSVKINANSFRYYSDNLPDSLTQFRRRDLIVAPYVSEPGTKFGVAVYGGVFTYTGSIGDGGNPFTHPIYVPASASESYLLDTSFTQVSNIYSAPSLAMYSLLHNTMFTSIFGGLGDTVQSGGDNAAFTTRISTIARNYGLNSTSVIYNPDTLPAYVGAEGLFVPAGSLPWLPVEGLRILDYDLLPPGKTLVGHIYGGILSKGPQWGPPQNPTWPSNRVYSVYITKTAGPSAAKK